MNLQGLGEQGVGNEGESAPGMGLEETAGVSLGPERVQFGWSEGPVGSEAVTVVGRPRATPGRKFFSPGLDTWQARCLGADVRPVAVFLEPRAKPWA